jgi:hypothetical protein
MFVCVSDDCYLRYLKAIMGRVSKLISGNTTYIIFRATERAGYAVLFYFFSCCVAQGLESKPNRRPVGSPASSS